MANKSQYGLGKGLGALLGGEDLSELRKPVGYINKEVVSKEGKPQAMANTRLSAVNVGTGPLRWPAWT